MVVDNQLCLHCGACVGSCPTNSLFLHETSAIEFMETCTECAVCVLVCPVGAIAPGTSSASEPACSAAREAQA